MTMVYIRTVQEFVEDMLSEGKTAFEILIVSQSTGKWQHSRSDIKTCLKTFSGKLKEKYTTE